jgi:signal transduction histidine kinase
MTAHARIVVVDDEVPLRRVLCEALEAQEFEVVGFSTGREALEAIRPDSHDLLLSDLMMPEMDGITLLRLAQQQDPTLVGIIMTGVGTIATAVEAMKAGALDYILKPFRLAEAIPVISRALAVRRLRQENSALQRQVREHAAELEVANRDLEAFSYSVSHDLSAPLRRIDQFASIISADHAGGMSQEGRRLLERIQDNARHMGCLIQDLLALSQVERAPLAVSEVDLGAEAADIIDGLRQQEPQRHVEVAIGRDLTVQADPGLTRILLQNLLGNAWKYTGRKPEAHIKFGRIEEGGRPSAFFVRDDGAGFAMAKADRLFAPFQRLHRSDDFAGNGIGLSIVARIVKRHDGRVWADSTPDHGSTFFFTMGHG